MIGQLVSPALVGDEEPRYAQHVVAKELYDHNEVCEILDLPSRTVTRLARQRVLKFSQDAAGNIGIAAESVSAEAQRRTTQSRGKLAVRTLSYGLWWLRDATDRVYFALHTVYTLAVTPLRSPPPFQEGDTVRFTEDPMEIPGLERGRVYRVKRMVADGRGWSVSIDLNSTTGFSAEPEFFELAE